MAAYGWRARLGLIVPPRTNETILYEMMRAVPEGVSWCVSTLGLREQAPEEYSRALENIELCAQELAARRVDVISYAGIPLTSAQGPTYHEELAERIRKASGSAVPVTTSTAASLMAFRHLNMKKLTVISNYQQVMVDRLVRTLEYAGCQVACAKGIHLTLAQQLTESTFDSSYDMALQALEENPDTDGFFLSCPQWPVVGNIERIEQATGKPVVTQLQAIAWWAMNALGIQATVPNGGRLFSASVSPVNPA